MTIGTQATMKINLAFRFHLKVSNVNRTNNLFLLGIKLNQVNGIFQHKQDYRKEIFSTIEIESEAPIGLSLCLKPSPKIR